MHECGKAVNGPKNNDKRHIPLVHSPMTVIANLWQRQLMAVIPQLYKPTRGNRQLVAYVPCACIRHLVAISPELLATPVA